MEGIPYADARGIYRWGKKKESNPNRSLYQEAQLKRMLRDTAVEVFALRDAGRNIMEVCNPRQVEGDNPFANDVGVSVGKGELNLAFKDLQQRDLVLENIMTSEQLEEADRLAEEQLKQQETGAGQEAVAAVGEVSSEPVQSESASAQVQQPTAATATKAIGADDKWLVLGLADPAIKFAVSTRLLLDTFLAFLIHIVTDHKAHDPTHRPAHLGLHSFDYLDALRPPGSACRRP